MVQFPRCRFCELCIHSQMNAIQSVRVTPFGHPRISGCLLLPVAFRSLPRPSSPDSSKASPANLYSLDHITPHSLFSRSKKLGLRRMRVVFCNSHTASTLRSLLCSVPRLPHVVRRLSKSVFRGCTAQAAQTSIRPKASAASQISRPGMFSQAVPKHRANPTVSGYGGMGIRTPDLWLAKPSL